MEKEYETLQGRYETLTKQIMEKDSHTKELQNELSIKNKDIHKLKQICIDYEIELQTLLKTSEEHSIELQTQLNLKNKECKELTKQIIEQDVIIQELSQQQEKEFKQDFQPHELEFLLEKLRVDQNQEDMKKELYDYFTKGTESDYKPKSFEQMIESNIKNEENHITN